MKLLIIFGIKECQKSPLNALEDVVNAHLELTVIPQFYWMKSYQPPDLFHQSPPPEFSPLMVG